MNPSLALLTMMPAQPTRAELLAALSDPDPANPLAVAVSQTLERYTKQLAEQAGRNGAWPNPLILPAPVSETEAFALELFMNEIAASGITVRLKGDS
jgi:hypothetical protein